MEKPFPDPSTGNGKAITCEACGQVIPRKYRKVLGCIVCKRQLCPQHYRLFMICTDCYTKMPIDVQTMLLGAMKRQRFAMLPGIVFLCISVILMFMDFMTTFACSGLSCFSVQHTIIALAISLFGMMILIIGKNYFAFAVDKILQNHPPASILGLSTETGKNRMPKNQKEIDPFRETGMTSKSKHITTRDLIYIAIFGVIGGIISSTVPFSMLIKFWYPLTGGTQLVSGHHVIWFTMIYGLTKKFGAATTCSLIKGFFEFLLGDNYGGIIIAIDLLQGFLVDLTFLLLAKKGEDESKLGWALAGGFATFSQAPIFWLLSGNIFILPWVIALTAFLFAFISGILLAGLLGKVIRDGLIRAGVPVPFSIPKRISPEIQS